MEITFKQLPIESKVQWVNSIQPVAQQHGWTLQQLISLLFRLNLSISRLKEINTYLTNPLYKQVIERDLNSRLAN